MVQGYIGGVRSGLMVLMGGKSYPLYLPGWQEPLVNFMVNRVLAVPKSAGGLYELTPKSRGSAFGQPQ